MYKSINYPEIDSGAKYALLKDAYLFACMKDIEVIKPGNVYINAPHEDLSLIHI